MHLKYMVQQRELATSFQETPKIIDTLKAAHNKSVAPLGYAGSAKTACLSFPARTIISRPSIKSPG